MLYSVVASYCTTKSISSTYTYIPSFLDFLPFWIKQSPVLYCGSHGFSTLYIVSVAYICQSRSPNSSHAPWCPYVCYLCLCLYFCFAKKIIYIISLDSTPVLNILSFPGFVNQTLFKKERERFQYVGSKLQMMITQIWPGDKISFLEQVYLTTVWTGHRKHCPQFLSEILAHLCSVFWVMPGFDTQADNSLASTSQYPHHNSSDPWPAFSSFIPLSQASL